MKLLVELLESHDKREVLHMQQKLLDTLSPEYSIDLINRGNASGWFDLIITNSKAPSFKLNLYSLGSDGWEIADGNHRTYTSHDVPKLRQAILNWFGRDEA